MPQEPRQAGEEPREVWVTTPPNAHTITRLTIVLGMVGAVASGLLLIYMVGDEGNPPLLGGGLHLLSLAIVLVGALVGVLSAVGWEREGGAALPSATPGESPSFEGGAALRSATPSESPSTGVHGNWPAGLVLGSVLLAFIVVIAWMEIRRGASGSLDLRVAILFHLWALLAFVLGFSLASYYRLERHRRGRGSDREARPTTAT